MVLNRWYRHFSERAPDPYQADMAKVAWDYVALYWWKEPTPHGRAVPTHVKPFKVNENFLFEGEGEAALQQIRLHKAGGHTLLCAEHFTKWLREAYPAEETSTIPRPDWCQSLVDITQFISQHGEIPR